MARARKATAKKDTTIYRVTVCGKAYTAGVKDRFEVPITKRRNTGLGFMVQYDLGVDDLRRLADVMADLATPEDESQYDASLSDAIYRDFDRFPEAAGVR